MSSSEVRNHRWRRLSSLISVTLLGCALGASAMAAELSSGIDLSELDAKVRPQDDLDGYVNGLWKAKTTIPEDKADYGVFYMLYDQTQEQLRTLVEQPVTSASGQKVHDLYQSFMDEARVESLGLEPLKLELDRIAVVKSIGAVPALMAHLSSIGVGVPIDVSVHPDNKNSSQYLLDFNQSGLGMPDRDYYLLGDEHFVKARAAYEAHIAKMLSLAGASESEALAQAAAIVKFETRLAKAQWSNVELRDPVKAYNKKSLAELKALSPNFDLNLMLNSLNVKTDSVNVSQPNYVGEMAKSYEPRGWRI